MIEEEFKTGPSNGLDSCPASDCCTGEPNKDSTKEEIISNRRRKKLLKLQKWLDYKPVKRAMEREKVKKRKQEARLNNTKIGPSRKTLKRAKMSTSRSKVNLVIDFSFNHLMNDKDLNKCLKQLGFCYGANRRVPNPVQFYVTSFNGRASSEMEKNEGYTNWDVYFREEAFSDIFKKEDVIYLTSDSDNVLSQVEDNKAYIIGGLVDHNSQKGLCLKTAIDMGLAHARLPIEEYIDMKTRKVLAINHVFEIMANVSNGCTWKDALLKVIPYRKGVYEKSHEHDSDKEMIDIDNTKTETNQENNKIDRVTRNSDENSNNCKEENNKLEEISGIVNDNDKLQAKLINRDEQSSTSKESAIS